MHIIVHHRNYLIRYVLCFLAVAALSFIAPAWLPWPLRSGLIFSLLLLYLFVRVGKRLIAASITEPSTRPWRQIFALWGWQSFAAVYWFGLLTITHSVLHYPYTRAQHTWFALDAFSKIPLLALMTTMLAYVTYRYQRPLTLVAFFPIGATALTRLVIFGNTWLRDATTILCLFSVSASITYLLSTLLATQPTAIIISFLTTAFILKARHAQRLLRRLATQYGFASSLLLITAAFFALLGVLKNLSLHWGLTGFQLPAFLNHLDAYTLSQCLSLILIAPLAFKSAIYCRGLTIGQAVAAQCLNPILITAALAYYGVPIVHDWLASDRVCSLMALLVLATSLYYGNSTWFANMTERCFTDTGYQHHGPLRWFFNQRLQRALLVWLLIMQFGAGRIAILFLGGIALGLMIVYSYCYCFFWERLRDESQCI